MHFTVLYWGGMGCPRLLSTRRIFLYYYVFCVAKVLAHRGKYWTMLQNACRALWNMTQTVLMRVVAGSLHVTEESLAEGGTDVEVLRTVLWRPFYWAADCLLDMMVHTQSQAKLDSEYNKKVCYVYNVYC